MRAAVRRIRSARPHSSCATRSTCGAPPRAPPPQWPELPPAPTPPQPELALWGTEIGLWDWNISEDQLTWINDWCEQAGLTEFAGPGHERLWTARMHPDDLPVYEAALERHLQGLTAAFDVEYRLRDREERWVWIQEHGRVIERNGEGRALRMVGLCLDVGERRRTAHALDRSQARIDLAMRGTDFGFWDIDVDADEIHWWNDWYESVDIDPCIGKDHAKRWDSHVHPDDLPLVARYDELIAGRRALFEAEYRVRTRSGAWRWLLSRGRPTLHDGDGRVLRVTGVTVDIDARRRAELALRASEARLEATVWGAGIGLWESDTEGGFTWFNDWCNSLDIDPCDGADALERWRERVHPADLALVDRANNDSRSGDTDFYVVEYRIRTLANQWRWLHERGRITERDSSGRARHCVGVCLDIDARRRAEQLLLTQARILETMREGVILVDSEGRIEFTNPAFDNIFGWQSGELRGTSVLALLNFRPRSKGHPIAIERLLRRFNARTSQLQVWLQRRDHTQFAAEVLSARIEQSGSEKILFVVQDVSERKRLEQEITEAASRERRRLGSDLHDGLGQELTGISLLLRSFARQLTGKDGAQLPQLDEIISLVNHAIQATRTLALGLSPATPARDGFVASLSSLASWSRAHFGIDVELRLAVPPDLRINEVTATHLYLIAQEAILNAVKHGRAQAIIVSLRVANQMIRLSIADDGGGLPKRHSTAAGMGIKIMEYRAGMIGGSVQIKNRKNGGARVVCIFPMVPRKAAARSRTKVSAQAAPSRH
jgi:PAS domain S-box-containing protein